MLTNILILIPFAVLSIVFTIHSLKIIQRNETASQKTEFQINSDYLNSKMDKLSETVGDVIYSNTFADIEKGNSIKDFYTISSSLQAMEMSHNFDYVFLYFFGENNLYSPSESYGTAYFSENMYDFTKYYQDSFENYLNRISRLTILGGSNIDRMNPKDRYITIFYPVYSGMEQNGVIFFFINEKGLSMADASSSNRYMIFDQNNNVISKSDKLSSSDVSRLQDLKQKDKSNGQNITLDGRSYYLQYSNNDNKKLGYMLLIPHDKAYGDVIQNTLFYTISIIVILIVGAALVYILTRYNYKPIRALVKKSSSIGEFNGSNEIDNAGQTIDFLYKNNLLLKTRQKSYSRYVLLNLLNSTETDSDKLKNDCIESGITFDKKYFQVFTIRGLAADVDEIRIIQIEKAAVFYVDTISDYATFIVNTDSKKGLMRDQSKAVLQHFRKSNYNTGVDYLALGKAYDNIANINKSYIESIVAAKYSLNLTNSKMCISYDDIPAEYLNRINEGYNNETPRPESDFNIENINRYINEHYLSYSFSIQEVASHFDVHISYLSQYFSSYTSETINDYVTNLRIRKAQDLLIHSSYSISRISEMVGYVNESSFIRRFKQICGVTPGEFRQKERAQAGK